VAQRLCVAVAGRIRENSNGPNCSWRKEPASTRQIMKAALRRIRAVTKILRRLPNCSCSEERTALQLAEEGGHTAASSELQCFLSGFFPNVNASENTPHPRALRTGSFLQGTSKPKSSNVYIPAIVYVACPQKFSQKDPPAVRKTKYTSQINRTACQCPPGQAVVSGRRTHREFFMLAVESIHGSPRDVLRPVVSSS